MSASLSRRLAEHEGAESALVLASGRAAVACTVLALLRPGDHVLAGTALRPSTRQFFEQELPALGVEVTFIDPRETRGWRRGLRRTTRAVFLETPVLASGRLIDLRPPRSLTQELGIAFIVDASAASPVNFTPIAHGADVVVHDATCCLDPLGDGEAGVVCGTDGLVEEVRLKMESWGAVPHPLVYQQLEHGLATLDVRVQRQNETALRLAHWAAGHHDITDVHYAGLETHPDRAVYTEYFKGAGALVQVCLAAGHEPARVAARAAAQLDDAAGSHLITTAFQAGEEAGWLQVRVGLESVDVIVAALLAALTTSSLSSH